jgi:dihydrofolate reductase
MGRVTYATNLSVDGYIEDATGAFDFGEPDAEVFQAHTDLVLSCGTYLYGRRLYEAMAVWETDPTLAEQSEANEAFASAWQDADKIVYSTGLAEPSTTRTRIERSLVPAAVAALKASTTADILVGGADLAAQLIQAGLVDECQLYVWPVTVGGGKPALPTSARVELALLDVHRFGNGVLRLGYRPLGF